MARKVKILSAREVETITKPGMHADGNNLYLRVLKSGGKSWVFRYRTTKMTGEPARREMHLGSTKLFSLKDARIEALKLLQMLHDGVDPIDERQKEKNQKRTSHEKQLTFQKCGEEYINIHNEGWKNPKHRQQWKNTLATYAYPKIGKYLVGDIETLHIKQVLNPIWKEKTETAKRLRGRIEKILDWARHEGYRKGENPARWKGHLEHSFISPSRLINVKHHSALPFDEMNDFLVKLQKQEGVAAKGLEFIILTATRTGETRLAVWDEIDFVKKLWTIPAERMKMKKAHEIPLQDTAIDILHEMKEVQVSDFIFPGIKKNRPLSDMTFTKLLRRMEYDQITVHGFRSSFRDWAAERTSYPREVVEMALAHEIENKVEAAYRRGNLLEKRRELMNDWSTFVFGGKVILRYVPLGGSGRATKKWSI
ncbi:Phage integrase [Candidatus Terasakiella magnetica]|uniref:Phage integrase n=1 Tax=Candidatus Terasakiella magnetica TaxID=1867952 RepID=A0A1C3RFR7_9PROT|nr:integrase arm-type DNA-binding domain-containing protein [Candidatus Terasakiella magnetica]SCA56137.1 Phage integrase [Candidatus Terasakiella magnetica]